MYVEFYYKHYDESDNDYGRENEVQTKSKWLSIIKIGGQYVDLLHHIHILSIELQSYLYS